MTEANIEVSKKKEFIPGQESKEQFDKVVSLLLGWIKAGIVIVGVDSDGDIDFDLPEEMNELLKKEMPPELTKEQIIGIIRVEIRILLSSALSGNPKYALKNQLPEKLSENIDDMLARANNLVERLVDKNLKERILLRKTSSAYIVKNVNWNLSTYHIKQDKNKKTDVPYVSLKIDFTKPSSGRIATLYLDDQTMSISKGDDIGVVLELHRDDIKDLRKKIDEIIKDIPE